MFEGAAFADKVNKLIILLVIVCGELIILQWGGHCSFYLKTPENKGFSNKKGVSFDTTQ